VITLTLKDTVDTIAAAIAEHDRAVRQARIANAKNNTERLMAAGVIITADDAYDNAMRHQGIAERAKENGRTFAEQEAIEDRARTERNVRYFLEGIARDGETPQEKHDRQAPILAAKYGQQIGYKRPCTHRTTKTQTGWVSVWGGGMACRRCGAEATGTELARKGGPSEQGKIAAALLAILFLRAA
jgi:hypothetical protein